MKNLIRIIFAFAFFSFGWPPNYFPIFLFIAFVPVFFIGSGGVLRRWLFAFGILLLWNTIATYWIYKTIPWGAPIVHTLNALIFSIPFLIFFVAQSRVPRLILWGLFVSSWIALEFLHLNWELGYPFLTLGNGLARFPILFQWYEFTGVLGGSLWILCVNIMLAEAWVAREGKRVFAAIGTLVIPLLISVALYATYDEATNEVSIASLQTSMDCRTEKYTHDSDWVVDRHIELSASVSGADYLLWPETSIVDAGVVGFFAEHPLLAKIQSSLPGRAKTLMAGAIVYKDWGRAGRSRDETFFYAPTLTYLSAHNAVLEIQPGGMHPKIASVKQRLVPFEEGSPYPLVLGWVRDIVSLGGFTFSRLDFDQNGIVSPVICYEILFGREMAVRALNGAELFCLHLNEGWYRNTTGAGQFLYYTSLRAVELRRAVARSSNFGFSALIDQRGRIVSRTDRIETNEVVSGTLNLNEKLTFYARYGDFIGWMSLFGLVGFGTAAGIKRKRQDGVDAT